MKLRTKPASSRFRSKPAGTTSLEKGYALLLLMMAVTILLVSLTAALPSVYVEGQREREEELIFRGNEYARAIGFFHRRFNRYPTKVDELIRTNGIRFLRHPYKDPMTKDGKWRLIHVSANGAVLDSRTLKVLPGPAAAGGPLARTGQASALPTARGGHIISDSEVDSGRSISNEGSSAGANAENEGAARVRSRSTRLRHPPNSDEGSTKDALNNDRAGASIVSPSTSDKGNGKSENQLLGAFIVGVASTSEAESIRVLNDKTHYDDWEFLGVETGAGRGGVFPGGVPGGGPGQPVPAHPGSLRPSPSQGRSLFR